MSVNPRHGGRVRIGRRPGIEADKPISLGRIELAGAILLLVGVAFASKCGGI